MPLFSIATSELDTRSRVAGFQDTVAELCRLEFTPDSLEGFRSATAIGVLPEVMLGWGRHSTCRAVRTVELAASGSDNVMVHFPRSGAFRMQQTGGAEVICGPGQIYIDPNETAGVSRFLVDRTDVFYISLPRPLVTGLRGINDHLRTRLDLTPQWRLLQRYGEALFEELPELTPDQLAQSSAHLHDLALSAFSARDPGPLPGTMAARLRMIKDDIAGLLHHPDLSPGLVAARHGISTRYLRMMFAEEKSSFRAHVLEERLRRAHGALSACESAGQAISDIAGAAGFSDLSWFNHCYRRRFNQTPRETRAEAGLAARYRHTA
ncbi:AraC family transcriptional regulator [Pararhodobacter zhoushanensis]|uniref:AraC family transcriptional regulator n=1 Tax=Pararhodobacter zhoushanensis TaxID=2479545 RepID=UPI0013E0BF80|nr:AraC family transcriptional regulator [Pararhodobacter zhoushanensis]